MGKVKRQRPNLKCKKGQSKKATGKKGKNGQSKEVKKRKKATLKCKKGQTGTKVLQGHNELTAGAHLRAAGARAPIVIVIKKPLKKYF